MTRRVFISYRRDKGSMLARLVKEALDHAGCDVFLDVDDLGSGHFDRSLLSEIESRANFVLLCTAGALDRCREEADFLRLEIAHAIATRRNVVPVVVDGFEWPDAPTLPESVRELRRHNHVEYSHAHWDAARERILRELRGERRPFRITIETDPARFEACRQAVERIVERARQSHGFDAEVHVRLLEPRVTSADPESGLIDSIRAADLLLVDVASPCREPMLHRMGLATGLGARIRLVTSESSKAEPPRFPDGFPSRRNLSLAPDERPYVTEHLVREIGHLILDGIGTAVHP